MKAIKLTKKMLKMTPSALLKELGAYTGTMGFPEFVFVSKEDAKKLRAIVTSSYKKEFPGLSKQKLAYAVGMEWLSIGPNESLAEAIAPGYILVDEAGLEQVKSEVSTYYRAS